MQNLSAVWQCCEHEIILGASGGESLNRPLVVFEYYCTIVDWGLHDDPYIPSKAESKSFTKDQTVALCANCTHFSDILHVNILAISRMIFMFYQ